MPESAEQAYLFPDWPAPNSVHACCTTRAGGHSQTPYDSLNLAEHVGDDPARVDANRQSLTETLHLPGTPLWLGQTHSNTVLNPAVYKRTQQGDAMICRDPGQVAVVMTADCLPVLLCSRDGLEVAAVHCGWRGLLGGILDNTLAQMQHAPTECMAWLGPAIGPSAYEIDAAVYRPFVALDEDLKGIFKPVRDGHWLMDIYAIASGLLKRSGVSAIYGGGLCTCTDRKRFFSYRRDGVTGRMASLIWIS